MSHASWADARGASSRDSTGTRAARNRARVAHGTTRKDGTATGIPLRGSQDGQAAAELVAREPELAARLVVLVAGGPSGTGLEQPRAMQELAATLGIGALVRFMPPQPGDALADVYRAADVVAVPSHNESFGLVALEAQACATPVVAAAVGGLPVAVADGVSALLVDGHRTADWADALGAVALHPGYRERLAAGAAGHARRFSWDRTTDALLATYADAARALREQLAAIEVLGTGGSVPVAIITVLVINLRMMMYSASLAPWLARESLGRRAAAAYVLTDQAYAVALHRYSEADDHPRLPFYLGAASALWVTWQVCTVIGTLLGGGIPDGVPLGFAIPLVFLTLLPPAVTDRPTVVAALVGATVATVGAQWPANLGMLSGAVAGVTVGAALAMWTSSRAKVVARGLAALRS